MPGVPEFHHDWAWPLTMPSLISMVEQLSAPVVSGNWGAIAGVPRVSLVQPLLALLGVAFGTEGALKVLIVLAVTAAGTGLYVLARTFRAGRVGACAAGIYFACSPFIADQIVAGHIWMVIAYAAFPWALASIVGKWSSALQFILIGLTGIDVHFIGFDVIALAVLYVARIGNVSLAAWSACALAFLSQVIASLFAASQAQFAGQEPTHLYNIVNSTALLDAVRGIGYFADYDRAGMNGLTSLALFVPAGCAIVIALVKRGYVPLAYLSIGVIIVSGVHGPLGPVIDRLLVAVPPFAIFRELFNFSVFVVLGGALAIALCSRHSAAALALALIVIFASMPALTGEYFAGVRGYALSPRDRAALRELERLPRGTLVAMLPLQTPLGPAAFSGGVDPFEWSMGAVNFIDGAHGLPAPARFAVAAHPKDANVLAGRFGIGAIMIRQNWQTKLAKALEPGFAFHPPEPGYRGDTWILQEVPDPAPLVALRAYDRCVSGDLRSVNRLRAQIFAVSNPECGAQNLEVPQQEFPYPARGWVSYENHWYLIPDASAALPPAIMTTQAHRVPSPGGCTGSYQIARYGARTSLATLQCAGEHLDGVVSATALVRPARTGHGGQSGTLSVSSVAPWLYRGNLSVNGDALLDTRLAFARDWVLWGSAPLTVKAHVVSDGYFNAWRVAGNGTAQYVICYWPALLIVGAELAFGVSTLLALLRLGKYGVLRVRAMRQPSSGRPQ